MADQNIEDLRREAEAQRQDLAADVELVADRVSPTRIAGRQKAKITGGVDSLRDRVFGTPDHRRSADRLPGGADDDRSLRDRAGDAAHKVREVSPSSVSDLAEGNPLAAGVIGLGVGLLVATLLPGSEREQRVADDLQDRVDHAAVGVVRSGQQAVEPAVQEGVDAVKESAQDSVQAVKEQTKSAADDVRQHATDVSNDS